MVLAHQTPIGLFNFRFTAVFIDTKYFVRLGQCQGVINTGFSTISNVKQMVDMTA